MANATIHINSQAHTEGIDKSKSSLHSLHTTITTISKSIKDFHTRLTSPFKELNTTINKTIKGMNNLNGALGLLGKIKSLVWDISTGFIEHIKSAKNLNPTLQGIVKKWEDIQKKIEQIKLYVGSTFILLTEKMMDIGGSSLGGFEKILQDVIPKLGAGVYAAFAVGSKAIQNIIHNFTNLTKIDTWKNFFQNLKTLGLDFVTFLGVALKTIFKSAIAFLGSLLSKLSFTGIAKSIRESLLGITNFGEKKPGDIVKTKTNLLGHPTGEYEVEDSEGKKIRYKDYISAYATADRLINEFNKKKEDALIERIQQVAVKPDETTSELALSFSHVIGDLKQVVFSFADTLAGFDVRSEFTKTYNDIYGKMVDIIKSVSTLEFDNDTTEKPDIFKIDNLSIQQIKELFEMVSTDYSNVSKDIQDIITINTTRLGDSLYYELDTIGKLYTSSSNTIKDYITALQNAQSLEQFNDIKEKIITELHVLQKINTQSKDLQEKAASQNIKGISLVVNKVSGEWGKTAKKIITAFDKSIITVSDNLHNLLTGITGALMNTSNDTGKANSIIEGFKQGGFIGAIIAAINIFVDAMSKIENFGKAINPITTILDKMVQILEPVVNKALAPLVVFLELIGELIGELLGPLFELFFEGIEPIFSFLISIFRNLLQVSMPIVDILKNVFLLLTKLNPLFQILTSGLQVLAGFLDQFIRHLIIPILNFLQFIVGAIFNGIIGIINGAISVLNWIPGVNIRKLDTVETKDLEEIGNDFTSWGDTSTNATAGDYKDYTSTTNGTGSYTAQKDIIVNFTITNSLFTGDPRDIALELERALNEAHSLGY